MQRPFIIGVAGGTGSGKTTVAERLAEFVSPPAVSLIRLDSYYCTRPELTLDQRSTQNYDHPDAFDWPLLFGQLRELLAGRPVEVPTYDYTNHLRATATETVEPSRVLVVEGILVLNEPELREFFDLSVFVDTDADVRFIRRLQRDVAERGRTPDSVIAQYFATVRPMHLQFCEPSKRYADVIVPHGGRNDRAMNVLFARIRELSSFG